MLYSPPLPAAAIFSSGGMLEAAVTAESERGMKDLTLCSPDAHETRQSARLWEVTPRAGDSLQEKKQLAQQRGGGLARETIKEKDLEQCPLRANMPPFLMIIILIIT